jgi:hypothetical protein
MAVYKRPERRPNYDLIVLFLGRVAKLIFDLNEEAEQYPLLKDMLKLDQEVKLAPLAIWDFRDLEWLIETTRTSGQVLGSIDAAVRSHALEIQREIADAKRRRDELIDWNVQRAPAFDPNSNAFE